MPRRTDALVEGARTAPAEEIPPLLGESSDEVLRALLENPRLDETHLVNLLKRRDLPLAVLEAIAAQKKWLRSYRVRRSLALHAHAPRLLAMRLARDLFLMDLVTLSLLPSAATELRKLAEELILARIPQLPLGQKFTLARRGSARVAGALLAEGHAQVVKFALDNAYLNESQILRVLAKEKLPLPVVQAVARHRRWSQMPIVLVAMVLLQ
jgi:hypothetical protein